MGKWTECVPHTQDNAQNNTEPTKNKSPGSGKTKPLSDDDVNY